MSFNARTFIFDGVPCEEYGLMLYNFDNPSTRESNVGTNVDIMETRLNRSTKPIFYGTTMNEPLQFSLTFGSLEPMTKYEVDLVAGWLTGHNEYKWLEIIQDDLVDVRYKCFINNLKETSINGSPVAFTCDVICDSQFAYEYPQTYTYKIDGETTIDFFNRSSHNGYLYPKITISDIQEANFAITNCEDNERSFVINKLPTNGLTVAIDCERQIITQHMQNSATITIPRGRVRGDVNGDSRITKEDADMAQELAVGAGPIDDELARLAADMDGDGLISANDALAILKAVDVGPFVDILGNWKPTSSLKSKTKTKADVAVGKYYNTDVKVDGIKKNSNVIIYTSAFDYISADVIEDGMIRFYCSTLPSNDLTAEVRFGGDGGKVTVENITTGNLYPYTNYKFPRLIKGQNKLKVTGNCTLTLQCEFLRKVGS